MKAYNDIFNTMFHCTDNDIDPLKFYVQKNPDWFKEKYKVKTIGNYNEEQDIFEFCNEFVGRNEYGKIIFVDFHYKYTKILNYLKLQYFLRNNQ